MWLKFRELTRYDIKNNDYPYLITKEIIYENKNVSDSLTTEVKLKSDTFNFVELTWAKTRNKYIRFLKSCFIEVYVLNSTTGKTVIYSIDCTPKRKWFLENNIKDEFKTNKYKLFIKISTVIDKDLLNYKNKKFTITKKF